MSKNLTSYIKYFIIFIAVLFFLFPIYWMFITTMKPQLEVMYYPPLFIPPEFTIKYYIEAFYWLGGEAFKNSLIITTCTTIIATVLGCMAGYSFARFNIGGFHLPFMILSIKMLPVVAFIIPLFFIAFKLNMIDTYLPIILSHLIICLPFAVWMMRGFFIELPVAIEEAATIDGCNNWPLFWRIAFPLAAPGIAVTTLFCFIFSWNEFVFALVLSRKEVIPITISLTGGLSRSTADLALASIIPILIFSVILNKYLVRGLTLGAIK